MLTGEIESKFPKNFHPLENLSNYSLWEERGLRSSTISVFPKILTTDELYIYVDKATKEITNTHRDLLIMFLKKLSNETKIYHSLPYKKQLKALCEQDINIRFCIRLFEKCRANLFLPEFQVAIRGGDDFSANIVYTDSIPAKIIKLINESNLHLI